MQYLIGQLGNLHKIRAAIDVLAEMPKPEEGTWYVFGAPHDLGDGRGMLAAERALFAPYAGLSAEVQGETVQVPTADQLIEHADLPADHLDWLWLQLYPAEFFPDGPPPRPETWAGR